MGTEGVIQSQANFGETLRFKDRFWTELWRDQVRLVTEGVIISQVSGTE